MKYLTLSNAVFLLKLSLVLVYIWFGLLKVFDISPVKTLVEATYPQFPQPIFMHMLGIVEVIIGILFLFRKTISIAAWSLIIHLGGIFMGMIIHPSIYLQMNNPLLLNTYGEFVIKNLVLITAALVVWFYQKETHA